MKRNTRQYTIRNVPDRVDFNLRKRAKTSGRSFNHVALEALTVGAGEALRPHRDLSEIVGSLNESEAELLDDEIRKQRQVDPALWR